MRSLAPTQPERQAGRDRERVGLRRLVGLDTARAHHGGRDRAGTVEVHELLSRLVHQRGLDLLRRPVGVQLHEQRGGPGDVRRGHRRAADRERAVAGAGVGRGDRVPRRRDVRLQVAGDASGTLRGEGAHVVLVARDHLGVDAERHGDRDLVVRVGGVRTDLGRERRRVVARQVDGGDRDLALVAAGADDARQAAEAVPDDHGDRPGLLRVDHLVLDEAVAGAGGALEDQRDLALERHPGRRLVAEHAVGGSRARVDPPADRTRVRPPPRR